MQNIDLRISNIEYLVSCLVLNIVYTKLVDMLKSD